MCIQSGQGYVRLGDARQCRIGHKVDFTWLCAEGLQGKGNYDGQK